MMKITKIVLIAVCSVFLLTTLVWSKEHNKERKDVIYYCDCGAECKCNTVSTKPGNCKCDKPMKWGHVVKIEGNEALVCSCGKGCSCQIDPNDPSKCGCGNPVKRVNLKGTGMYFCNCGGSCVCNTVSDKTGKCKCNMNLKKAD